MKKLAPITIDERTTPQQLDRVVRDVSEAIGELQQAPIIAGRPIANVKLVDGFATPVPHGMGRPVMWFHSGIRGAVSNGRIDDLRDGNVDRSKYISLRATGYGATIYVDVWVV